MTAADRAARGAVLLDEKRPGWAAEIDLSVLVLDNACRCVLGQLFAPAGRGGPPGYWIGLYELLGDDEDLGVEDGFTITDRQTDAGGGVRAAAFAELDELWVAEIRRRTETTT